MKEKGVHNIAIIPARGGSKGLKGKNIYPVAGRPLLAWSIMQARQSRRVDRVFVSTDDPEIAEVAGRYGAGVIRRPAELSGDRASSESALLHAVEVLEREHAVQVGLVVFLQATSPLRKPGDIDRAIERFESEGADSLISVTRLDDLTLWERRVQGWESVNFDFRNRGMRQERVPQYIENGSIYLVTPEVLRMCGNRIGNRLSVYEMEFWQTWEIDSLEEIDLIEFYMFKKNLADQESGPRNP
ncbi:acylneuraminate cytidylyltransferase family protein [Chlorobium sp.]|uniref:acylneuraminate cytidylyltransferase family protein n=1 Tax=Chlorobium sp. TaxID=1095 RepID=UPI0025B841A6|nr:acylneuraminate cytidylyltransferase family protein [Chlorobium sp.]